MDRSRGGATGWSLWAADHPALRPTKAHRYSRDWRIRLCAAQPSTFCLSANAHRIRLRPFFSVRLCGVPSNSSVCMRCSRRSRLRGDGEHGHRASGNSAAALQVHVHLNPDTKTQQQPKPISLLLAALLSFSHVLTFLLVLSFSNFFHRDYSQKESGLVIGDLQLARTAKVHNTHGMQN